jgi:hypothetical protein
MKKKKKKRRHGLPMRQFLVHSYDLLCISKMESELECREKRKEGEKRGHRVVVDMC